MASLFAAQAGPPQAQGPFRGELRSHNSNGTDSPFKKQLATQTELQGDNDTDQTPDAPPVVSSLKADSTPVARPPAPLTEPTSPWTVNTRQIIAAIAGQASPDLVRPPGANVSSQQNPATVSAAPPLKTPDRAQSSQGVTTRDTRRNGSAEQVSTPDPGADSTSGTSIDLSAINLANVFASATAGAVDPLPGKANPSSDKTIKIAVVKSGTPDDLSVSQPQSAPKTEQTDVAFAVRVSTDKAPNANVQDSGDSVSLRLTRGDREQVPTSDSRDLSKSGTIREADFPQGAIPRDEANLPGQNRKTAEPQGTASTANADSEQTAPTGDTIKILNVRMNADGEQHVAIRVVERSGELSVSVRSADPVLTRTLQDRMPELTSRLQDQQIQADTWVPRSGESANSREQGFHSPQGQSQQHDSGGNRGRRQERQPRPEWVQELESIAPNSRV